jgi:hypothetical protein
MKVSPNMARNLSTHYGRTLAWRAKRLRRPSALEAMNEPAFLERLRAAGAL